MSRETRTATRVRALLGGLLGLALLAAAPPAGASTGAPGQAPGESSGAPASGEQEIRSWRAPTISGVRRYGAALTASAGTWSVGGLTPSYQWLRGGEPIGGATGRTYRIRPTDLGRRLQVRVTVRKDGYAPARRTSASTSPVAHRVDWERTVTYRVETRGRVDADVAEFARQAQETYDDARGWRGGGTAFRRVAAGSSADFSLVLATPAEVARFSPVCSATWSCRVGRYVVINEDRWLGATRVWREQRGSLRDYRHMVVDHETGHWLGLGHAGCPGPGRAAPVMMQQSKGLDGCRGNPWPTPSELARS